jgi:SAM-dependent methyltransferase
MTGKPEAAPTPSTEPSEGPTSAAEFFGTQVRRWAGLYETRPAFRARLQLFTRHVEAVQKSAGRVLDFGCGPGVISLALARSGHEVLGLDGSTEMIAAARREAESQKLPKARFEVMDARGAALPAEAYDVVICSSVIEYVQDDLRLVRDLIRSLHPGGHLLVSVPQRASLGGALEDVLKRARFFTQASRRRHLTFSLRRYERGRFLGFLRDEGLVDLSCKYFEFPALGGLGIALSGFRLFGLMMLVVGRKAGTSEAQDRG